MVAVRRSVLITLPHCRKTRKARRARRARKDRRATGTKTRLSVQPERLTATLTAVPQQR